jgi:NAD(P)-dependent dehydrogenase (short-subunit alcohol dehydrogenase family)
VLTRVLARELRGRDVTANAVAAELERHAADHGVDLRPIELDVAAQESVDDAIAGIVDERGRLDVVVHNAGHMVLGPAERSRLRPRSRPATARRPSARLRRRSGPRMLVATRMLRPAGRR